jgi:hypothetical protein
MLDGEKLGREKTPKPFAPRNWAAAIASQPGASVTGYVMVTGHTFIALREDESTMTVIIRSRAEGKSRSYAINSRQYQRC